MNIPVQESTNMTVIRSLRANAVLAPEMDSICYLAAAELLEAHDAGVIDLTQSFHLGAFVEAYGSTAVESGDFKLVPHA